MLDFTPSMPAVGDQAAGPAKRSDSASSLLCAAIEVGNYTPEKASDAPLALATRQHRQTLDWGLLIPRRGRIGSIVCGAVIAALHVLVFVPLLPGSSNPHRVTNAMGSSSNVDVEPTLQVSFIEESPLTLVPPPTTTAVTMQSPELPELPQLEPPPDLLKSMQDEKTSPAPSEMAGNSALAGRYIGQIDARIERAWIKPRTPVGSGEFRCKVRVEQDKDGTVLEIQLEQCNANARWQQSLVSAIQTASPLPAPSDPKVFRKSLQLSFTGKAWSNRDATEGYEPLVANGAESTSE